MGRETVMQIDRAKWRRTTNRYQPDRINIDRQSHDHIDIKCFERPRDERRRERKRETETERHTGRYRERELTEEKVKINASIFIVLTGI